MYPAEELRKLELRKLHARLRILQHRQECVVAGRRIADGAETLEMWRERAVQLGGMLKFAPGIFGVYRGLRGWFGRKSDSDPVEKPATKMGKVSSAVSWLTTGLKAYNTFRGR